MLHKLTNSAATPLVIRALYRDPVEIPAGESRLVDLAQFCEARSELLRMCVPATAEDCATVLPLYPTAVDYDPFAGIGSNGKSSTSDLLDRLSGQAPDPRAPRRAHSLVSVVDGTAPIVLDVVEQITLVT